VLLLFNCSRDESHLSDEELSNLLADVHISELSLKRHDEELRDSLKELYIDRLCKIHDITREEMKYELELLNDDRERQSDIYVITIEKLQELEKEFKRTVDPKNRN
jgi:hypothetical protein